MKEHLGEQWSKAYNSQVYVQWGLRLPEVVEPGTGLAMCVLISAAP